VQLLTRDEQMVLASVSRVVEINRKMLLYSQGEPTRFVYNIISGVAKTYHLLSDGECRITGFLFPSDLLGLSENGEYVGTAEAITALVAYQIPSEELTLLVKQDPKLDAALLCKLCHDLRESERHVITAMQYSSSAKLAGFLLWLWQNKLPPDPARNSVNLPMLYTDVADYLGMSAESVSRALLRLERKGLIKRSESKILQILNIPALQKMVREV